MNSLSKIMVALLIFGSSQLFASYFNNKLLLSNFNPHIVSALIILLIVLIIILLFFIIRSYKKKKIISKYNKRYLENNVYVNNLISTSLNNLKNNHIKSAKQNLKQANIYLNCILNKTEVESDKFNLYDFISELYKDLEDIGCSVDFLNTTNLSHNITTSKEILYNIFFMLIQHQIQEHNIKKCVTSVNLNRKDGILTLEVLGLPYNNKMQEITNNIDEPIYDFKNNIYNGVYLFILNRLLHKIKGQLKIDINSNIYSIQITIPVKTEKIESRVKLLLPIDKLEDIKVLIISSNEKIATDINTHLTSYNIESTYLNPENIIEVPDFLDYDILIADSNYLQSIVSDYLLSIKNSSLKIVALEDENKKYNYQNGLVDYSLKSPILQSKIYKMILDFYSQACLDIDETKKVKKEEKNLNNNRVLIADDNRVNLKFLKKMLELHNIKVETATNGQEVLDILDKDSNFNLIILDSIMPKMDAYTTIKEIRKIEKLNSIPVIIHTSFSYDHSVEEIFELGFDSYLPKPFTDEQLRTILHRYLKITVNKEVYKEKINKESLEEFLAIYANSGKILEKYIKQNQIDRAKSLLNDLKAITLKIDKRELLKSIKEVEKEIESNDINLDIIHALKRHIEFTAKEVQEDLNKLN